MQHAAPIVNDVTRLNPIAVWAILKPTSTDEVQKAVARSTGAVSVGGGHFSMGGQTASPNSLHLDMRAMNKVLAFYPEDKVIRVQAGIRWCDIQKFIDPHNLSVKIMQTYANFTVGGSLSVNVHGRYMDLGPIILSICSFVLVKADGQMVEATPTVNTEIFYAVIGGYGGLGVIVEVELGLVDNVKVERIASKMRVEDYWSHFKSKVRHFPNAVFHNADLYPPHYKKVRSVTWVKTERATTEKRRLQTGGQHYALQKYFVWAITETPFGKWRREYIIDPLLYLTKKIHWRNFEAGYDVAELEPFSRTNTTYVLQEYFVPVASFESFVCKMAEILKRYKVNTLNVSVRHAKTDPGSVMAWARGETFAFVLYYKQRTRDNAINRVGVWTRELIDAAISVGGTYYLPYQPHATTAQFHAAYPRAQELFLLKRQLDPDFRFRNVLWDKYYAPTLLTNTVASEQKPIQGVDSEFKVVFSNTFWHDGFYKFLQNIYRLYPEDRFHTMIKQTTQDFESDEIIYRNIQKALPSIKPFLADLTYALPSLFKQKKEMARQTLQLLGNKKQIDGYLEIGSTGRYISELKKHVKVTGHIALVNESAPNYSPVDIAERGQIAKLGQFYPLNNYLPLCINIKKASLDVVTCYVGLHHAPLDRLDGFIRSVAAVLRKGGLFILRDHDVTTPQMHTFVSLIHTVFNAGLNEPWELNQQELRHFRSIAQWIEILTKHGFVESGTRILQANDPSLNVLMSFTKSDEG